MIYKNLRMESVLYYYLRLLKVERLGIRIARRLIDHFSSIENIFDQNNQAELKRIFGANSPFINRILSISATDENIIQNEIAFMKKNNIDWMGISEKNYPNQLRQCDDAPLILFCRGKFENWNQKSVAVVGTRKASSYGLQFCTSFINDIVPYSPIIISGLAMGIDIKAHNEALCNNLQTIAVMGTSFLTIYPKQHLLQSKAIEQNGLLVTEYPTWSKPVPELFVRRNRIIAGLSDGVVVVQSPKKGGSLTTAFYANEYNREVYAVPGRVDDALNEGCMWLVQENRAQLILSASDLIHDLKWDEEKHFVTPKAKDYSKLDSEEIKIIEVLKNFDSLHIDDLAFQSNIEMSKLNSLLMMLEIKDYVKALPGKHFSL